MSRQLVVRTVLRLAAVALAVTLTVALSRSPASGAFSAVTGTSGSVGTAADFCTAPGPVTLTAAGDSWINQQAPGNNYGVDTALNVRSAPSNNQRILVRFALPVQPAGCSLASATLRLYNRTPTTGRVIDAYRGDPASAQWTAAGVTWTNQPAVAGTAVGSTTVATAGWQTWTVTAHVQAQYAGTNNGFLLRDRTEGTASPAGQVYDDLQHATNGPRLVLTWT